MKSKLAMTNCIYFSLKLKALFIRRKINKANYTFFPNLFLFYFNGIRGLQDIY